MCTEYDLTRHHGQEYKVSGKSETSGDNYDYKVILGESITQVSTAGHGTWLLGKYNYTRGGTEFYKHGDGCGSGINRHAKITFLSTSTQVAKMFDASEPSTCEYEFTMLINCKNGNILVLKFLPHF